jgi:hypothetical protein
MWVGMNIRCCTRSLGSDIGIVGSQNRTPNRLRPCSDSNLATKVIASASPDYRETFRNRSALAITETELKLIAALASIGLNNQPNTG